MTRDKMDYRNTLLTLLAKKEKDGLRALLAGDSRIERLAKLDLMLNGAALRGNDKEGSELMELIAAAVHDVTAEDYTDEAGRWLLGPDRGQHNFSSALDAKLEVHARFLWPDLPLSQRGTVPVFVAQDEIESRAADLPTMTRTREALFTLVLAHWRSAVDDVAASESLAWFLEAHGKMRFREDIEAATGALRRQTENGVSSRRLLEGYRLTRTRTARSGQTDDLAKVFAMAWMRMEFSRPAGQDLLTIAETLQGSSRSAYHATAQAAARFAEQDRLVQALIRGAITTSTWASDRPAVNYRDGGRVELSVQLSNGPSYDGLEALKNWAHDEFGKLREKIASWLAANAPGLQVRLTTFIPSSSSDKFLFTRSQDL